MAAVQPPPPERVAAFLARARLESPGAGGISRVCACLEDFIAATWMSWLSEPGSIPWPYPRNRLWKRRRRRGLNIIYRETCCSLCSALANGRCFGYLIDSGFPILTLSGGMFHAVAKADSSSNPSSGEPSIREGLPGRGNDPGVCSRLVLQKCEAWLYQPADSRMEEDARPTALSAVCRPRRKQFPPKAVSSAFHGRLGRPKR